MSNKAYGYCSNPLAGDGSNGEEKILTDLSVTIMREEYSSSETIPVKDLKVTATYLFGSNHYEVQLSEGDFETNIAELDMSTSGEKIVTETYTDRGVTKTVEVRIQVNKSGIGGGSETEPPTQPGGGSTTEPPTQPGSNQPSGGQTGGQQQGEQQQGAQEEPIVLRVGDMFEFADGSAYKILSKQGDTMEVQYATAMFRKTGKKIIIPDEVIAPDGTVAKVISIEERAFLGKTNITNVTIGKNVKTIGEEAFYGCKKLKSLTLGSNVTTIGNKAFYKCVSLKKVVIPTKVNKIGKQAFYGCKNLKNITIKTKKLTSKKVGSNAFKKVNSKVSVKVPKSKLRAYKKLLKAKGIGSKAKIKK